MARKFLTPVELPAGSTAPTPSASDNSTKLATTAYVDAAVAAGGGGGGGGGVVPLITKTASATLALTDAGSGWIKSATGTQTWTIPPNSSVAFDIGTIIPVINDSTSGTVTIARGSGVTLMNGGTNANYTLNANVPRAIIKVGTDRWRVL